MEDGAAPHTPAGAAATEAKPAKPPDAVAEEEVKAMMATMHDDDNSDNMVQSEMTGEQKARAEQKLSSAIQALRHHAESALMAAAASLDGLETEADGLAQWAAEIVARLKAKGGEIEQGKTRAAISPEARKQHVEAAEALYEALVVNFRATEKVERLEERKRLDKRCSEVRAVLCSSAATNSFDHGHSARTPSDQDNGSGSAAEDGASASGAATRLDALLARVEAAFTELEASEDECERTLLTVLSYKQTDKMSALAESKGRALRKWFGEQTAAMSAVGFAADREMADVPTSRILAASTALTAFASEIDARGAAVATIDATLAEVATRRADEERAPLDPSSWRDGLVTDWDRCIADAVTLRRSVGRASRWQVEQAKVLASQWVECEEMLAATLPHDEQLVGPEKPTQEGYLSACVVM